MQGVSMPVFKKAKKKYVSEHWGCNFCERYGFHTFLTLRKRTLAI